MLTKILQSRGSCVKLLTLIGLCWSNVMLASLSATWLSSLKICLIIHRKSLVCSLISSIWSLSFQGICQSFTIKFLKLIESVSKIIFCNCNSLHFLRAIITTSVSVSILVVMSIHPASALIKSSLLFLMQKAYALSPGLPYLHHLYCTLSILASVVVISLSSSESVTYNSSKCVLFHSIHKAVLSIYIYFHQSMHSYQYLLMHYYFKSWLDRKNFTSIKNIHHGWSTSSYLTFTFILLIVWITTSSRTNSHSFSLSHYPLLIHICNSISSFISLVR